MARQQLVPLFGTRTSMQSARDQRAAAARQVRVLFFAVWLPVLVLLAWRVLGADAGPPTWIRVAALGIFGVGVCVAAWLVMRRSTAPLLLVQIDSIELHGERTDEVEREPSMLLACSDESGAAVAARLALDSGGNITVQPGTWTLLASTPGGALTPWRVAPAVAQRFAADPKIGS